MFGNEQKVYLKNDKNVFVDEKVEDFVAKGGDREFTFSYATFQSKTTIKNQTGNNETSLVYLAISRLGTMHY